MQAYGGSAQPPPRPSDGVIARCFAKVGGSLEEALRETVLEWQGKDLDDEDARVVAYVMASSAVLTVLK